jgi:hypothetical protein
VDTLFLQLKPFVATYLGVVNVSFPSHYGVGSDWWTRGVPVVHLDKNQHILFDDADVDWENETGNSRQSLNRKLQKQIFKEAWSPKSLRARFEHVNEAATALKRNNLGKPHELNNALSEVDELPPKYPTKMTPSVDTLNIFQMSDDDDDPKQTKKSSSQSPAMNSNTDHRADFNPWSLQLYHNQIDKFSKAKMWQDTHQFLLLEDLTSGLAYPCILDLKMGTRQHGVHASTEKRLSQERKCERSTSKKLGVRICGMQVFYIYLR